MYVALGHRKVCVCVCVRSALPSEELPGESGLLERLAIRCRARTALPVFYKFFFIYKGQKISRKMMKMMNCTF